MKKEAEEKLNAFFEEFEKEVRKDLEGLLDCNLLTEAEYEGEEECPIEPIKEKTVLEIGEFCEDRSDGETEDGEETMIASSGDMPSSPQSDYDDLQEALIKFEIYKKLKEALNR